MFACRSCGGPLRFDIASGQMHCSFCNNYYDPYEIKDSGAADESKEYELTVFTCTQCGAELGSTETSAAEFCSFCGAPTVLQSRLCKMRKPDYLIPFQKTKEECREKLRTYLKKQFFVSGDFKKAEVEKIRGIYMPTWNYHVKQEGLCSLTLTEDEGDVRSIYSFSAEIDADYRGIPHDASESFSDSLSEMLEPYNYKARKKFAPAFLAGFFSDIQDVDESKYEKDACLTAAKHTHQEMMKKTALVSGYLKSVNDRDLPETYHSRLQETECTLTPVWFLAYRRKDRVAYAAINGETGKVVSDAPLSIGKVWGCALLLAIPIFFLLNISLSMRPSTLLLFVNIFVGIAAAAYCMELAEIEERDKEANWAHAEKESYKKEDKVKSKKKISKKTVMIIVGTIVGLVIFIIPLLIIILLGFSLAFMAVAFVFILFALFGGIAFSGYGLIRNRKQKDVLMLSGFVVLLVMSIVTDAVWLKDPVFDLYFYIVAVLDLAAILFSLTNVWRGLNKLTTRPLPQFQYRGGEEHEHRV